MDRQRSFSIKHTRFLVFYLTLSLSIFFLLLFSISDIRFTHSVNQHTHFHLGLHPLITGFTTNFTAQELTYGFLTHTRFGRPVNVSTFKGPSIKESDPEISDWKSQKDGTGNFLGLSVNNSVLTPGNYFVFDQDSVLQARNGNFSGLSVNKTVLRPQNRKDSVFEGRIGNLKGIKSDAIFGNARASRTEKKGEKVCDITKGKWVFDESYPLYTSASCPFIDEAFNCEANGRLNKDYMKWRWQPQDCDIPRFNATKMLELIRGKRIVFVGDSINRNQWESMLCLLMGAIKDPKRVYETRGRRIAKGKGNYSFKFLDYKCTVEYYVTHFLVHESKARIGKKRVQTLQIDTIDRGTSRGKGADILVFNTAHWWTHEKTKSGSNYYQEGNQVHPQLDATIAFQKAMITWSSWVDKYVGRSRKTKVFFRSSAPSHFRGGQWNAGGHCREASRPLNETLRINYPEKNMIVEEIIRQMKTPVTFLNITSLSDYRIDGHPSIYGRRPGPSGREDCSHWCLPGVPDTWNELLYFQLQTKLGDGYSYNLRAVVVTYAGGTLNSPSHELMRQVRMRKYAVYQCFCKREIPGRFKSFDFQNCVPMKRRECLIGNLQSRGEALETKIEGGIYYGMAADKPTPPAKWPF